MAERESRRSSPPLQRPESDMDSNPNIFSDDFALEPLEVLGTRPVSPIEESESHDAMPNTPRRSLSYQRTSGPELVSTRGSGLPQSIGHRGSISSRLNGRLSNSSTHPRSVTSVSDSGHSDSTQHHSVRTISTFGFPRAQSPYQGATGPSQPYGMYSQVAGLSRTPSTATTATIRPPERSYSGPSGPTQPYGMYAQNTVPEDDASAVAGLAPPIIAGVTGSGNDYQRRLGPEGEDVDDLIGPDGYTEQLPPYSRYANGVPPKYTSGIGSVNRQSRRSAPSVRQEERVEETSHNVEARDAELVNPFSDSSNQLSPTDTDVIPPKDEGGNFKEKVRRKAKKKVCYGVSCWMCIAIAVVVFLAVLLGGLVGGLIAHHRGEEKGRKEALAVQTFTAEAVAPTATITQMSPPPDVVSLTSTPSNLPPLPTGSFAVTLQDPIVATNSCLIVDGQACAWDCATSATLLMDVSQSGPNGPVASLSYNSDPAASIRYGAQPPELEGNVNLMLRQDKNAQKRGPAYVFAQPFNKTVIVRTEDLPGGYPGAKRSFMKRWFPDDESLESLSDLHERDDDGSDSEWTDNSFALPSDKPWYCFWNGTILEGFIFVQQDVNQIPAGSGGFDNTALVPGAAPSSSPIATRQKRQASLNPPPYPKVVKIEERRNYVNPVAPYCQQMQILDNNQPGPLTHPGSTDFIQIQLTEKEPLLQHGARPWQQQQQQGQGQVQGGDDEQDQDQSFSNGQQPSPSPPTSWPVRRRELDRRGAKNIMPLCQCIWLSK